jgi:hypothetical protein
MDELTREQFATAVAKPFPVSSTCTERFITSWPGCVTFWARVPPG